MNPDLILFDFDGTIADTFAETVAIVNRLAEKYGFRQIEEESIPCAREMNAWQLMKFLHIPPHRIPVLLRKGRKQLHRNIGLIHFCEGVEPMLHALREKGIPCGIVTSNSKRNVVAFLEGKGFGDFMFVRSSSRLLGKAREISKALRRKGVEPSRAVYVGDETRDIDASREAGLPVIAVAWGYNSEEALASHNPDCLVRTPQELLEVLGGRFSRAP